MWNHAKHQSLFKDQNNHIQTYTSVACYLLSTGKSEEKILKKLQDISSRQKQVEEQRRRKQQLTKLPLPKELMVCPPLPSCEAAFSPTPLSTEGSECNPNPMSQTPQGPAPPPAYQTPLLPLQPEKRLKIIPNILSKRSKGETVFEPLFGCPNTAPFVFQICLSVSH